MPQAPRLTSNQKKRLKVIEPALRQAALSGDFESAKLHAAELQSLLRPTGHEARLMQAKNWLFEAAMGAGHLDLAESGFMGVAEGFPRQPFAFGSHSASSDL